MVTGLSKASAWRVLPVSETRRISPVVPYILHARAGSCGNCWPRLNENDRVALESFFADGARRPVYISGFVCLERFCSAYRASSTGPGRQIEPSR